MPTSCVCSLCGKSPLEDPGDPEAQAVPITWMTSLENGKHRVFCEACSREHLRSIEAKLDSAWW